LQPETYKSDAQTNKKVEEDRKKFRSRLHAKQKSSSLAQG